MLHHQNLHESRTLSYSALNQNWQKQGLTQQLHNKYLFTSLHLIFTATQPLPFEGRCHLESMNKSSENKLCIQVQYSQLIKLQPLHFVKTLSVVRKYQFYGYFRMFLVTITVLPQTHSMRSTTLLIEIYSIIEK